MGGSRHTPGQWVRRRSGIWQYDPVADVVGKQIAKVFFPVSTKEKAADEAEQEEAFANARVMYASPDLLAACQGVLVAIQSGAGLLYGDPEKDELIMRFLANGQVPKILAKAIERATIEPPSSPSGY